MVRGTVSLLNSSAARITATLADILVCPFSKQPLRFCQNTNSLISDSIGVSYPIIYAIPHLVPTDGKIIANDVDSSSQDTKDSAAC